MYFVDSQVIQSKIVSTRLQLLFKKSSYISQRLMCVLVQHKNIYINFLRRDHWTMWTNHLGRFSTDSHKQSCVKTRATCAYQSEQTCWFFDQSGAKSKPIVTWFTCIFPRLTRVACFSSSFDWLIAFIVVTAHCAGAYRPTGWDTV